MSAPEEQGIAPGASVASTPAATDVSEPVEGEVAARLPVRAPVLDDRSADGADTRPGVGAALAKLVPLADDLSAAIAGDDLARAKAALAAIGRGIDAARELPPGASEVIDLSAERARRVRRRKR